MYSPQNAALTIFQETEYDALRRRLVHYFERRGCADAQDLADECVTRLLAWTSQNGTPADTARFAFGIARRVLAEHRRRTARIVAWDETEQRIAPAPSHAQSSFQLVAHDLVSSLAAADRALLEEYFLDGQTAHTLAQQCRLSAAGVRSRVFRLRKQLASSFRLAMSPAAA